MQVAVRRLLGSMAIGGVAGFGHGMCRGSPVQDMLVGGSAPIWAPIMIIGIPVRAVYLSCPHLNPDWSKD